MIGPMKLLTRALSPLAPVLVLSLMAAQGPASAAPVRKAVPAKAAATPARATNEIIPLPLNPVLPAGQRLCSAKAASGLGYTMLRPATGPKPAASDIVLVNYIGYLAATGAVFDQAMQTPLAANEVIPGFSEGIQMLSKGGVARFCIPAAMGYGAQESGPIPANSDLVFQVELVDYKTAAEVEAMRKAQAGEQPAAPPAPAGDAPTSSK
jgi:FKBP-type peptidyl-prolyl cis-trans isomerase FkpA